MGVNKVILIGYVGKEPEYKIVQENLAVASFSMATSENYTDKKGVIQKQTEWHNIVLWRHLADLAQKYIHKGTKIYVEGKIRTRSWDDQTGAKHYITEIYGENLELLSPTNQTYNQSGESNINQTQSTNQQAITQLPIVKEADDLPF